MILVPEGVEVTLMDQMVRVKGSKGQLEVSLHPNVLAVVVDVAGGKEMTFSLRSADEKDAMAQWGTARANVASLVKGVTVGYVKQLEVNGVGFRANLSGRKLVLNVGYSHEVPIELLHGIEAKVDGNVITLSGIDKHAIGELADYIRSIRPPEPYKGKGIKYMEETVRRKAGKTQKAGE